MIDLYLHMQVRMLRVYRNQGKEIEYKNAVTCHWLHGPPIQCILYGTVTGGEGGRGPTRTFSQIYYYNNVIQFANSLYYKSMQLQYYN